MAEPTDLEPAMRSACPLPSPPPGASSRPVIAAAVGLAAAGCASVAVVDPARDDGSAGFAAACVGVLAAEKAAADRSGGVFTVDGRRALNEWMFQASRRSSPIQNEIARAAERRRWAQTLTDDGRTRRVETCIKEAGL